MVEATPPSHDLQMCNAISDSCKKEPMSCLRVGYAFLHHILMLLTLRAPIIELLEVGRAPLNRRNTDVVYNVIER